MRALGDPREANLEAGPSREFTFTVSDASRCVRVLAAASAGVHAIELELLDEAGYSYGRNAQNASFALVGAHGPVCVLAGNYRVMARARAGAGRIAVALYQVE
jgi:hypothetical protein